MSMDDWINRKNAQSRHVPGVLGRLLLAWIATAIALPIAVPMLSARNIELRGWMIWTVIVLGVLLAVGSNLAALFRRRS